MASEPAGTEAQPPKARSTLELVPSGLLDAAAIPLSLALLLAPLYTMYVVLFPALPALVMVYAAIADPKLNGRWTTAAAQYVFWSTVYVSAIELMILSVMIKNHMP